LLRSNGGADSAREGGACCTAGAVVVLGAGGGVNGAGCVAGGAIRGWAVWGVGIVIDARGASRSLSGMARSGAAINGRRGIRPSWAWRGEP
jgi:hypothetical protein